MTTQPPPLQTSAYPVGSEPSRDGSQPICLPDPFRRAGQGHTLYVEGVCQTCGGRRETDEEYHRRVFAHTGRQAWMEAAESSEGAFEDRAVKETLWMRLAPVGVQNGTYFKTARTCGDMDVWRWGGRDPVTSSQTDRASASSLSDDPVHSEPAESPP